VIYDSRMLRALLLSSLLPLYVSGCSQTAPDTGSTPKDSAVDTKIPTVADAGMCGVTTSFVEPNPAIHVDQGSTLTHGSNPPCGGNHYPIWATWGPHASVVPRGNWIHNLEHGGVVFLYRCASREACPEVAAKLEALAASLPQDPSCATEVPPIRNRIVVTADPELPAGVQIAAASWGYNLVARCLDEAALREFYNAHFGRAPENFCSEGSFSGPPGDATIDDAVADTSVEDSKGMGKKD
jgi:hypothetical protein